MYGQPAAGGGGQGDDIYAGCATASSRDFRQRRRSLSGACRYNDYNSMIPQQQADAEMGMAAPGASARTARRLPPAEQRSGLYFDSWSPVAWATKHQPWSRWDDPPQLRRERPTG